MANLGSYAHFRSVQTKEKKVLIEQSDSIYHADIFDPVETDLPKGAWSLQTDSAGVVSRVRSLIWPGYVGYHVAGTRGFGGIYFGNGLKNKDLAFMV